MNAHEHTNATAPHLFVLLNTNGVGAYAWTVALTVEQAASHFAAHVRGARVNRVRVQGPALASLDGSVTIVSTGKVLGGTAPAPAEESRAALPRRRRTATERLAGALSPRPRPR